MLIEVKLTQDDADFGPEGTKVMIGDGYIVGVAPHETGSKIHVDVSDLGKFKTLYTNVAYESWYIIRLNP